MNKNLETLHVIAKVAKIFSLIAFIFTIIGAVGCVIGLIFLLGINNLVIGGVDLHALIVEEANMPIELFTFGCIIGIIYCIGECIVSRFAYLYFNNELERGTPFTYEGSKEVLRLGIISIVIPIVCSIISGVVFGVYSYYNPIVKTLDFDYSSGIGVGILFIIASVVFKYGADILTNKTNNQ